MPTIYIISNVGDWREECISSIDTLGGDTTLRSHCGVKKDIPLLTNHFIELISKEQGLEMKNFTKEAMKKLDNYSWTGNIRELRNLIERIAILQPNSKDKISNIIKESLKNTSFDNQITENSLSVPLKEAREKFEKEYLTIQLKKFNGKMTF